MKVRNWWRTMVVAILASGALLPGVCRAVNIALLDPSFETYTVPSAAPPTGGYAYADTYRPTSAWVDDLDSPSLPTSTTYVQDNVKSNWLYNAAYAEFAGSTNHFRGNPRTGNQAMHGLSNYSAQKLSTTFAAGKYYVLSAWAQGDADATAVDDRAFLYIFNGSVAFSEANSLAVKEFQGGSSDFPKRGPTMTATESKANWGKISILQSVYTGDAAVGQPIGVGFYALRDAAIDDVSLISGDLLTLEVNTTNGQTRVRNQGGEVVTLDYYDIKSASGALNFTSWSSLQQQNLAGFPAGNGSGNGWEKAGGSSSAAIGESYLLGNSSMAANTNIGLGGAFTVGGAHDLVFEYGAVLTASQAVSGDYNNNGIVDAGDYDVWRHLLNQNVTIPNDSTPGTVTAADYTVWRANFGKTTTTVPSTELRGVVKYVTSFSGSGSLVGGSIPEPTSVVLVGIGIGAVLVVGGRPHTRSRRQAEK